MSITNIENIQGKNVTPPVNTESLLVTTPLNLAKLLLACTMD